MGSKKHKKHHKSERRELPNEERVEKPLRLVLKVSGGAASRGGTPSSDYNGESSTLSVKAEPPATYQETEPTYYSEQNAGSNSITLRSSEKHKKSKKKKKKKSSEKDKERKHKHHHKHHHHHHTSDKKMEHLESKPSQILNEDSSQGSAILGEAENLDNSIPQPVEEMDTSICSVPDSVVASPVSMAMDKTDKKSLQIILMSLFKSIQKKDPDQFFAWPVSDVIAPGYSTIIFNPMDFSTMKLKIDKLVYSTIEEFKSDVKLICDNCMTYNRPETIYYKSARRLLHSANKMMGKDKLLSLKKSLILAELQPSAETTDVIAPTVIAAPSAIPVAATEAVAPVESSSTGDESPAKKFKPAPCIVNLNPLDAMVNKSQAEPPPPEAVITSTIKFKPVEVEKKSPEDIEAEQILLQAQAAAKCAADKLSLRKPNNNLAYLTQKEDGTTTLNIIKPGSSKRTEKEVTFGMVMGKLKTGTGTLETVLEDKSNLVKPVNQLEFGSYSSFAPTFDSAFANLNEVETNLIYSTYGDELGVQYAKSILRFTENSDFALEMAEKLLDRVTNGNHSKVSNMLNGKKKSWQEEELQTATDKNSSLVDFESMDNNEVQQKLDRNAELIQDLNILQHERLSQKLPPHLSHIAPVSERELQLASQVQDQLKELTEQASPMDFVSTNAVRKAMGSIPL